MVARGTLLPNSILGRDMDIQQRDMIEIMHASPGDVVLVQHLLWCDAT